MATATPSRRCSRPSPRATPSRALVPGRPRRLRGRPRHLRRARPRARGGVPRRQPRPRRRGEIPLEDFSRGASLSVQWTQEVIAPANLSFLAGLRPQGQEGSIGLYHASPRDPVWEYVLSALLAELCLDRQPDRIWLIGHSHVALSFVRHEGELATGGPCRDGARARPRQRRMAAEPRQRRPTARRGPPRRLAGARPRRADGLLPAYPLRRGRRRRRDSRGAPPGLARRAAGVRSMT